MTELMFLKELISIRQVNWECDICHNWYFSVKGFIFQLDVCNGCHDVLLMSMNQKPDLKEKSRTL